MKNNSRKQIIPTLLLIIAILIGIIIYQNYRFIEEKNSILKHIASSFSSNLLQLCGNIDVLLYLLEHNATVDPMRYVLENIECNSHVLSQIYSILHHYTKEQKYWKWHLVFEEINSFAMDLTTDESKTLLKRLQEKAALLEEISTLLQKIAHNYRDLELTPIEEIDKVLSKVDKLLTT